MSIGALGMTEDWRSELEVPRGLALRRQERRAASHRRRRENVSEGRRKYLGQQSEATSGSGVVDHIAFRARGLADTIAHLRSLHIDFKERMVSDQGLYQLFMFRS